ncbi:hypothetical protein J4573_24810 [Actinomadura barringtoniae]|uniref:Secreted protein n=1 Tax=Actinomadura barringtoniae TaxID=1427535 RepID=A0A939PKP9_9ACTN|nr:hypothetical protein [Actinomadura barringtoniae]MBO2450346.1 hypothetical protein [Actinomadura barringtoniae]
MTRARIATLGAAAMVAFAGASVPIQSASADPGFCGVRSFGPKYGENDYIYAVRNKCSKKHSFRVNLDGWKLNCKTIDPGETDAWASVRYTTNWRVEAC